MLCVLLAYPVAYFLTTLEGRRRYALLVLLLVPLLMSYVIKIYAMRSILGGNGFLNRALLALGLIDQPLDALRLQSECRAADADGCC